MFFNGFQKVTCVGVIFERRVKKKSVKRMINKTVWKMKLLQIFFCVTLVTKMIFSDSLPSNDHNKSSSLTGFPHGIPSNTRLLKLSSKNICHLLKQDVMHLKELRFLNLGNNCISHISREVLCEIPKLQKLILRNNKIESLDNGTFSCLKR